MPGCLSKPSKPSNNTPPSRRVNALDGFNNAARREKDGSCQTRGGLRGLLSCLLLSSSHLALTADTVAIGLLSILLHVASDGTTIAGPGLLSPAGVSKRASTSATNTHQRRSSRSNGPGGVRNDSERGVRGGAKRDGDSIALAQAKKRKGESSSPPFACPYWKLNCVTHKDCLQRYYLKDTAAVVQHLDRRHRAPTRCPDCFQVFASRPACDAHIQQQPRCVQVQGPGLATHGVTEDQFEQLRSRRALPNWDNYSQPARWYWIWCVLFGNTPGPSSPYVDSPEVEELAVSPFIFIRLAFRCSAPPYLTFGPAATTDIHSGQLCRRTIAEYRRRHSEQEFLSLIGLSPTGSHSPMDIVDRVMDWGVISRMIPPNQENLTFMTSDTLYVGSAEEYPGPPQQPDEDQHLRQQTAEYQHPPQHPGGYQYLPQQPAAYQHPRQQPIAHWQYPRQQPVAYQHPPQHPGEYQYSSQQPAAYQQPPQQLSASDATPITPHDFDFLLSSFQYDSHPPAATQDFSRVAYANARHDPVISQSYAPTHYAESPLPYQTPPSLQHAFENPSFFSYSPDVLAAQAAFPSTYNTSGTTPTTTPLDYVSSNNLISPTPNAPLPPRPPQRFAVSDAAHAAPPPSDTRLDGAGAAQETTQNHDENPPP